MKKCLVLAILAGSCAAAQAQDVVTVTPEPISTQRFQVATDGSISPMSGYEGRAQELIWNNGLFGGVNAAGSTLGAFHTRHLMSVNWAPGPWATQAVHQIDGVDGIGYGTPGFVDVPGSTIELRFYGQTEVSLDGFAGIGTSMIDTAATPDLVIALAYPQALPRTGSGYGVGWDVLPAAADLPGGIYWLDAVIIDGSTGLPMTAAASTYRLWGGTTSGDAVNPCYQVGTGSNQMGYDRNGDGVYTGAAAPGSGTLERTHYQFGPAAGFTNNRPLTGIWAFYGDVAAVAPVCGVDAENFTIGADNAMASDAEAIGANGVKIYCVTITADAIDDTYGYLNVDTEGSDNAFALGLYNAAGQLVASNDGGGSGVLGSNSQLSFGVGRLAAAGLGGEQYDGRHWNGTAGVVKGLLAGTYYLYVVPSDGAAPSFGGGFSVSGTGTGGNAVVRIQTNATNLTAPPAAVAPVATHLVGQALEDPPVAPGAQSAATAMAGGTPLWWSVNTCRDSDAAGNSVTFQATEAGAVATYGLYVFNSSGNLVGQAQVAAGNASVVFTDAPVLPAGTYYFATTYNGGGAQGDIALNAATDGRFHLRGRNLSNGYEITASCLVNWADCPVACDGDVNCDFALDGFDVETQEKAVGGDTTDYCQPDPDFNGDFALDGFDVEAVEIVTGGGPCP